MKRILCVSLLLSLALLPEAVEAQKKDKKPTSDLPKATAQEYAQANQMREIVGKLSFADGNVKTISIKIEAQHYEANPNFKPQAGGFGGKNPQGGNNNLYQSYMRLMQEQQRAMQNRNPAQRQQALTKVQGEMRQLMAKWQQEEAKNYQNALKGGAKNPQQNNNNQPYTVVTTSKEFDFEVQETAITRRMVLPVDYDDKGNLKQYSKEELAKLRGTDATKPGYTAKYEDLAVGQVVKLFLTPSKVAAKKAEGDDVQAAPKPTVRMILIQEDTPAPNLAPNEKKKK